MISDLADAYSIEDQTQNQFVAGFVSNDDECEHITRNPTMASCC
jgi:hypothetical protein